MNEKAHRELLVYKWGYALDKLQFTNLDLQICNCKVAMLACSGYKVPTLHLQNTNLHSSNFGLQVWNDITHMYIYGTTNHKYWFTNLQLHGCNVRILTPLAFHMSKIMASTGLVAARSPIFLQPRRYRSGNLLWLLRSVSFCFRAETVEILKPIFSDYLNMTKAHEIMSTYKLKNGQSLISKLTKRWVFVFAQKPLKFSNLFSLITWIWRKRMKLCQRTSSKMVKVWFRNWQNSNLYH